MGIIMCASYALHTSGVGLMMTTTTNSLGSKGNGVVNHFDHFFCFGARSGRISAGVVDQKTKSPFGGMGVRWEKKGEIKTLLGVGKSNFWAGL